MVFNLSFFRDERRFSASSQRFFSSSVAGSNGFTGTGLLSLLTDTNVNFAAEVT